MSCEETLQVGRNLLRGITPWLQLCCRLGADLQACRPRFCRSGTRIAVHCGWTCATPAGGLGSWLRPRKASMWTCSCTFVGALAVQSLYLLGRYSRRACCHRTAGFSVQLRRWCRRITDLRLPLLSRRGMRRFVNRGIVEHTSRGVRRLHVFARFA